MKINAQRLLSLTEETDFQSSGEWGFRVSPVDDGLELCEYSDTKVVYFKTYPHTHDGVKQLMKDAEALS